MDRLNVESIVMWAGSYFLIGMWNRALRGLPLSTPDRYRTGYVTGTRYQDRSRAGFVTLNKQQDRSGAGFVTWNRYQDRSGAGFVTWNRYQDRSGAGFATWNRHHGTLQGPGTLQWQGQGRGKGRSNFRKLGRSQVGNIYID